MGASPVTLSVAIRKRLGSFDLDSRFEAPAGITALFGPSGSGKTITLRSIAGLIRPDAGRIRIGQRLLYDHATKFDVPTRERRIGYLFQQYALFPHLDVAANVGYGLHRLPRSERDQRVQALLDLVGLGEFSHHRPAQLSGGQQQRVALARALAPAPDLLLLDEPFAAVDALVRQQLRRELRAVHEQTGLPMLLVTHDLAEVRQLADYVVIYYQGAAVEAGVPDEVIAAPKSEAGATLLKAAAS